MSSENSGPKKRGSFWRNRVKRAWHESAAADMTACLRSTLQLELTDKRPPVVKGAASFVCAVDASGRMITGHAFTGSTARTWTMIFDTPPA